MGRSSEPVPCNDEGLLREPYRDVEELGEVRKHGAVESVRGGSEEVGIVPEQDGQGLQVPVEVEEEDLFG